MSTEALTKRPRGRPKGKTAGPALLTGAQLVKKVERDLCKRFNLPPGSVSCDPLVFCLTILGGAWPQGVIQASVAGSENDPINTFPDAKLQIEAAKIASRYVRPQLSATEVTGPGGGPIALAGAVIDMTEMMKLPELRRKMEDLQIELARVKRLPEPAETLQPPARLSSEDPSIIDAEIEPAPPAE